MLHYIKKSIVKFKEDALSKLIYDFLKYILLSCIMVYISQFIPIITGLFSYKVLLPVWLFIASILFVSFVLFTILILKFNSLIREIKFQTNIDELTGVSNYKALEVELIDIFTNKIANDKFPISIILFDIDNFKMTNDNYGYDISDKILAKLGEMLKRDCRITDDLYRYFFRGDEFLIIAKNTNLSNAKNAAERKRKLVSETNFEIDNQTYNITISGGVTEINLQDTKEITLERVQKALLKAKLHPNKNKIESII